jgi:hypothetical protein
LDDDLRAFLTASLEDDPEKRVSLAELEDHPFFGASDNDNKEIQVSSEFCRLIEEQKVICAEKRAFLRQEASNNTSNVSMLMSLNQPPHF